MTNKLHILGYGSLTIPVDNVSLLPLRLVLLISDLLSRPDTSNPNASYPPRVTLCDSSDTDDIFLKRIETKRNF